MNTDEQLSVEKDADAFENLPRSGRDRLTCRIYLGDDFFLFEKYPLRFPVWLDFW